MFYRPQDALARFSNPQQVLFLTRVAISASALDKCFSSAEGVFDIQVLGVP